MEENIKSNQSPKSITDTDNNQRVLTPAEKSVIEAQLVEAIRSCYDPEIPVNVYDLGLIYGISMDDYGNVTVKMTLTTPYCPVAQSLPAEVKARVESVGDVKSAKIEIVWDPPWNPSKMSESARLELGFF